MTRRRWLSICALLFVAAFVLLWGVSPAAAVADSDPASHEYHAADLLGNDSGEIDDGTLTLSLEGTVEAGDTIEIAIQKPERNAFEIADVSDRTEDVGVGVYHTTDTIEIEFEDPGENGSVTGAELAVEVELKATESVASGASEYDATTVATVEDGAGLGIENESAFVVSVSEAAEIGFTAEEIDKDIDGSFHEVWESDQFVLTFAEDKSVVDEGDQINISVNPELIKEKDTDAIGIRNVAEFETQGENISEISLSESNEANTLDHYADTITVTIHTADGEPKVVSDAAIGIIIQLGINKESIKHAANRYHNADFLDVDVESEDNAELTDNADVHTESPLFVDIYPDDVEEFELAGPESGAEIGIGENRSVEIETARDQFENEIRRPEIEATLTGEGKYGYPGIEFDTDDRSGIRLERGGEIEPAVGVFDLTVEIVDIEGPKTHGGGEVVRTIEDLTIRPEDVNVTVADPASDFDAEGGDIGVNVDTGVPDGEIDRLDVELRRVGGNGTVTLRESDGGPTETDLWESTDYAGDGELRSENTWAIERDLTAEDFEDGVRTYTLEADTADRYEVAVDVMPYEGRLVADETDVNTSTTEEHAEETRETVEIVATGPIDDVRDVRVEDDRDFVGIDTDPDEEIAVEVGTFVDAAGNTVSRTDETVTVGFGNETTDGNGNGSVTVEAGPTTESPSATVSLDPTAIDPTDVDVGEDATITVEYENGSRHTDTSTTLVHRVIEPDDGWHAGSVPQPATLYVDADGPHDLVQWNPEVERYESMAESAENGTLEYHRLESSDLHRGFYFRSDDDGARLGYEFVTDGATADEAGYSETVTLEEGWHLAGANYDVTDHEGRELEHDLNWTGHGFDADGGAFLVLNSSQATLHDRTDGVDIDGSSTVIEHDTTYWVRVTESDEAPLTRDIVLSAFDEGEGVQTG